jgi:hypothetical protein
MNRIRRSLAAATALAAAMGITLPVAGGGGCGKIIFNEN